MKIYRTSGSVFDNSYTEEKSAMFSLIYISYILTGKDGNKPK